MDKFEVIKLGKRQEGMVTFNVRQGSYDIVREMSKKSGRSLVEIFDQMVEFCSKRFTLVDEREVRK